MPRETSKPELRAQRAYAVAARYCQVLYEDPDFRSELARVYQKLEKLAGQADTPPPQLAQVVRRLLGRFPLPWLDSQEGRTDRPEELVWKAFLRWKTTRELEPLAPELQLAPDISWNVLRYTCTFRPPVLANWSPVLHGRQVLKEYRRKVLDWLRKELPEQEAELTRRLKQDGWTYRPYGSRVDRSAKALYLRCVRRLSWEKVADQLSSQGYRADDADTVRKTVTPLARDLHLPV